MWSSSSKLPISAPFWKSRPNLTASCRQNLGEETWVCCTGSLNLHSSTFARELAMALRIPCRSSSVSFSFGIVSRRENLLQADLEKKVQTAMIACTEAFPKRTFTSFEIYDTQKLVWVTFDWTRCTSSFQALALSLRRKAWKGWIRSKRNGCWWMVLKKSPISLIYSSRLLDLLLVASTVFCRRCETQVGGTCQVQTKISSFRTQFANTPGCALNGGFSFQDKTLSSRSANNDSRYTTRGGGWGIWYSFLNTMDFVAII